MSAALAALLETDLAGGLVGLRERVGSCEGSHRIGFQGGGDCLVLIENLGDLLLERCRPLECIDLAQRITEDRDRAGNGRRLRLG